MFLITYHNSRVLQSDAAIQVSFIIATLFSRDLFAAGLITRTASSLRPAFNGLLAQATRLLSTLLKAEKHY